MIPQFAITADGENITTTIQKNFSNLTLTDKRNLEADQLDLVLSDPTGTITLPRRGVELNLWLGFENQGLVDKGSYAVDEIEVSGPPDLITIRARSANFRGEIKVEQDFDYDQVRLGHILEAIAKRNGLKLAIEDQLSLEMMQHIDQTNESDANFITRLAERYDAIATVKAGHLLFIPIGHTKSVSGIDLEGVSIGRHETSTFSYTDADRDGRYTGVKAKWRDVNAAKTKSELAGEEGYVRTLKEQYPTQEAAQAAAKSKWQVMKRGQRTMTMEISVGRPEITTNLPVTVGGFKNEINDVPWMSGDITHRLGRDSGYSMSVQLEEALI